MVALSDLGGFHTKLRDIAEFRIVGIVFCLVAAYACKAFLSRNNSQRWQTAACSLGIGILAMVGALCVRVDPVLAAFAAGLVTPRSETVQSGTRALGNLSMKILPLFFCYSGMTAGVSVSVGMILPVIIWTMFATVTKAGGAFFAAFTTMNRLDAGAITILINCRGLVGIIFRSLAQQNGLIQSWPYSVLIIVSLLTTIICVPALTWFRSSDSFEERSEGQVPQGALPDA